MAQSVGRNKISAGAYERAKLGVLKCSDCVVVGRIVAPHMLADVGKAHVAPRLFGWLQANVGGGDFRARFRCVRNDMFWLRLACSVALSPLRE